MEQHDKKEVNPIRGDRGARIFGPRNTPVAKQNPDVLTPPSTDGGTVSNMKWPFDLSHTRVESGGFSRETTTRELPISKTIAGVNMHLEPGAVRELHWHKEAEWAYMIKGSARVTGVDAEGRQFIDDVQEGGLWYFPSGIPHSIKGLEEGAEFILVFDDGAFSENSTFTISDWFANTPKDVLAANFGVSEDAFDDIPDEQLFIYQGRVPGPIVQEMPDNLNETVPNPYTFNLTAQNPIESNGGKVWIADSSNFKISTTVAAALVEVEPGGMREMHWHPNQDEWQYYLQGKGRMTIFASSGKSRTFNYQAGDVGYVPFAMGHYVQNTGNEPLRFLEMFKSDHFADISLNQWMSQMPPYLIKEHLNLDDRFIKEALTHEKRPNVKFD